MVASKQVSRFETRLPWVVVEPLDSPWIQGEAMLGVLKESVRTLEVSGLSW